MADQEITQGPTEVTTQGTTQGTTGNQYLTKGYLVRNLQNFWGKIKSYIEDKNFADKSYVNGAVDNAVEDKATKTELSNLQSDLRSVISTKVEQDTLNSLTTELTNTLANKVNKDGNKVLSERDFTATYETKLKSLPSQAATKTQDGWMSSEDKEKLDSIDVEELVTEVDTQILETSTNPVQNKVIYEALAGKVDKEDLLDPSEMLDVNLIFEENSNKDIILKLNTQTTHFKIHTEKGEVIDKFCLLGKLVTGTTELTFKNFAEDTPSITIPNPDGSEFKANQSYLFYIECFEISNLGKYEPFILRIKRGSTSAKPSAASVLKLL